MLVDGNVVDIFIKPVYITDITYTNATRTYFATIPVDNDVTYTSDRGRLLNDLITVMMNTCGLQWESEFLKNPVNPISGFDLTHIVYMQKSDFIGMGTTTDRATKGLISFNQLMQNLNSIFQLNWFIDDTGIFRIEHINYFKLNLSYIDNTVVGIDLTTYYPVCLIGSNEYEYNDEIPLKEQFKFMEAYTLDFTGLEIDYSDCVDTGSVVNHSAELITTDLDFESIFANGSKDGFALLHCSLDAGVYEVVKTAGKLTGALLNNGHFAWANLHDAYWKYNRPFPTGVMNGVMTVFVNPKKIVEQRDIQFPFCIENFNPNELITTSLGNGTVKSAQYAFKTGNLTVKLIYNDFI